MGYDTDKARTYQDGHTTVMHHEYKVAYKTARDLLGVLAGSVLDYGCGTGHSSRLLKSWGATKVVGVEQDQSMLDVAKAQANEGIEYILISNNDLSGIEETFTTALSSFVLLEIQTKEELKKLTQAVYEKLIPGAPYVIIALNPNAVPYNSRLITIVGAEDFKGESGQQIEVTLNTQPPLHFRDYFWTEQDDQDVLESAGFKIIEMRKPISEEGQTVSPFLVIKAVK